MTHVKLTGTLALMRLCMHYLGRLALVVAIFGIGIWVGTLV